MAIPAQIVQSPTSRGLRYGLFAAAAGPLELPEKGRFAGVRYEPATCGFARLYPVECPADEDPPEKVFDPDDPWNTAEPFVVYSSLVCPPVGRARGQRLEDKVRLRLQYGEQSAAEEGLADVLAAGATPIAVPDSDDLSSVVGALEQWLYGAGARYGNIGYLHAPIRMQAEAARRGLVRWVGPIMQTGMGTVWVFGGGFPDDGQIHISGQVTVWRDPEILVPPAEQTFDHTSNQMYLLAERVYAVAYDCNAASATYTGDLVVS